MDPAGRPRRSAGLLPGNLLATDLATTTPDGSECAHRVRSRVTDAAYPGPMSWRPLSVRADPAAIEEYDALHDGIPPWLTAGVIDWLRDVLQNLPYGEDSDGLLRVLEQVLRFPLDWHSAPLGTVFAEVAGNGPRALDIVDACLMLTRTRAGGDLLRDNLAFALNVGGSAWRVAETADGTPCLERRVDATRQASRTASARAPTPGARNRRHARRASARPSRRPVSLVERVLRAQLQSLGTSFGAIERSHRPLDRARRGSRSHRARRQCGPAC